MTKIAFFFPSNKIGGVEVMYARITEILVSRGFEVEIIDYQDGTMVRLLRDKKVDFKLNPYLPGNQIKIDAEYCVTSLLHLYKANQLFDDKVKLLFWDDHPHNLIVHFGHHRLITLLGHELFRLYCSIFRAKTFKQIRNFLYKALDSQGVVFMCDYNFYFNKLFFGIAHDPVLIPIPVELKRLVSRQNNFESETIHCSYLGRLDADKYLICADLMHDIIDYNKNNRIKLKLHIIGSGTHIGKIEEICATQPETFELHGVIRGNELDHFFSNKIDLSFAVGTSALESAGMGIPTVFLRTPSLEISGLKNRYVWVYNINHFDLAVEKTMLTNKEKLLNMDQLLNNFLNIEAETGVKCYEYIKNNHAIDSVIEKLLSQLKDTCLTTEKLK